MERNNEEKYSTHTHVHVHYIPHTVLLLGKLKELKNDCQIMKETFEREVDRKDSVIKSLAKDLEEANEQYEVALRSHLQNMEQLLSE